MFETVGSFICFIHDWFSPFINCITEGEVLCVDLKAFQEYSNLQQKLKDAEAAIQVLSSTPQVGFSQQPIRSKLAWPS